jgi:hypothetical protein
MQLMAAQYGVERLWKHQQELKGSEVLNPMQSSNG